MFSGAYTILTTKPASRLMSKDHPELLNVLPHVDNPTLKLQAKVTKQDASSVTHLIDTFAARDGEVYSFQIGWDDEAYPDKANIKKIEIYCGGSYGAADDVITYYPVTMVADELVAIYYQNSYGGIDSLICKGSKQPIQKNESIAARSGGSLLKDDSLRVNRTIANRATRGNLVHTGYSTRKELYALQDLFLINHAWELMTLGGEERFVPIDIDQSVSWPDNRENLQALPIRYRYSMEQKAITRVA
jgi:hypothetical protein